MLRKKNRLGVKREKPPGEGQGAFNAYMGYSGSKGYLSQFKNPNSTNSISTYNPFQKVLEQTGADDF